MNSEFLNYLKNIEAGDNKKQGFIVKSPMIIDLISIDSVIINNDNKKLLLSLPENIGSYTYVDFLYDFEKFLKTKNHLSSESIILSMVVFLLMLIDKKRTTAEAWREFSLRMFTTCNLHMEFPTRIDMRNFPQLLRMKNFSLGNFEYQTLKDKIKNNTVSDYWERFLEEIKLKEDDLTKLLSIKRVKQGLVILHLEQVIKETSLSDNQYVKLFDIYFEALSIELTTDFWNNFEEEISVSVAFGGAYYNKDWFVQFNIGNGIMINVFTHINNHNKNGWVIPLGKTLNGNIHFNSSITIPELNEKLSNYFNLIEDESEFKHLLKIYINYLSNGIKLYYENKKEEAYINLWTAFDAVLNSDSRPNNPRYNVLKSRIALLSKYMYSISYKEQLDKVKELYVKRNKFIHSGKEIENEDFLELTKIARNILDTLLNMHENNVRFNNAEFTLNGWYNNLHTLIIKENAKEKIDDEMLENIGIKKIED